MKLIKETDLARPDCCMTEMAVVAEAGLGVLWAPIPSPPTAPPWLASSSGLLCPGLTIRDVTAEAMCCSGLPDAESELCTDLHWEVDVLVLQGQVWVVPSPELSRLWYMDEVLDAGSIPGDDLVQGLVFLMTEVWPFGICCLSECWVGGLATIFSWLMLPFWYLSTLGRYREQGDVVICGVVHDKSPSLFRIEFVPYNVEPCNESYVPFTLPIFSLEYSWEYLRKSVS